MKVLLDSLSVATQHISVLDDVFRKHYPPYAMATTKLEGLPLYDELRREIYAGGKRRGAYGYGRQMILGDLLQYIFTGRGYYFAVRGDRQRETFMSAIFHACNLLILMEDISVEVNLRNAMLDKLRKEIGATLFEDLEQLASFEQLRDYDGLITPEEGREYDDIVDSMLPKRVGVVPELLVYVFLSRKNYGNKGTPYSFRPRPFGIREHRTSDCRLKAPLLIVSRGRSVFTSCLGGGRAGRRWRRLRAGPGR